MAARRHRRRRRQQGTQVGDRHEHRLDSMIARWTSRRYCADDAHAVAYLHAARWQRWRLILTLMLVTREQITGTVASSPFVAAGATSVLRAFVPDLPRLDEVGVDSRVLLYTMSASLITIVLCGVLSAVRKPDSTSSDQNLRILSTTNINFD